MSISNSPKMGIPDYQYGTVNAQKLVATVPMGTASVQVNIPANAETLIVTAASIPAGTTLFAQGVNTLFKFPGVATVHPPNLTCAPTWFFDISSALDNEIVVTFSNPPGTGWYVYVDSAARVNVDASALANNQGIRYVIPSAPGFQVSDHPPNEIRCVGEGLLATGTLISAPGVGLRLRIFEAMITPYSGTGVAYVQDNLGGQILCCMGNTTPARMSFAPSGLPMAGNSALNAILGAGVTEAIFIVTYTSEVI